MKILKLKIFMMVSVTKYVHSRVAAFDWKAVLLMFVFVVILCNIVSISHVI